MGRYRISGVPIVEALKAVVGIGYQPRLPLIPISAIRLQITWLQVGTRTVPVGTTLEEAENPPPTPD